MVIFLNTVLWSALDTFLHFRQRESIFMKLYFPRIFISKEICLLIVAVCVCVCVGCWKMFCRNIEKNAFVTFQHLLMTNLFFYRSDSPHIKPLFLVSIINCFSYFLFLFSVTQHRGFKAFRLLSQKIKIIYNHRKKRTIKNNLW